MAFDKASEVKDKPTAILAKTFKGAGVKGEEHVLYLVTVYRELYNVDTKLIPSVKLWPLKALKYFIFIPNTEITRKRVVDNS